MRFAAQGKAMAGGDGSESSRRKVGSYGQHTGAPTHDKSRRYPHDARAHENNKVMEGSEEETSDIFRGMTSVDAIMSK